MLDINGALKAIGYGLLVLFFVVGVMKTCGGFVELRKPEQAVKLFFRFILAKAMVGYGLDLMMALFSIVQGTVSTMIHTAGFGVGQELVLPQSIVDQINEVDFMSSIPLWIVTLLGGLFITVLSFIMIMTVYTLVNAKNLHFFFPSLFVLDVFQELLGRNKCDFYALSSIVVFLSSTCSRRLHRFRFLLRRRTDTEHR